MALNSFVFEMQVSANDGDLQRLQAQLSQWESQITSNNITQADADHLGFKPSVQEKEEVYCILNRPYPHSDADHKPADLVSLMLNRLMIQAARKDQVHVVRYILQERGWSISRIAIGRAVGTYSFGVLECFQEHGWDINEPVREHQCSMLRHVVNNETRVRWFLEHGADPNAQNAGKNLDVLSHAGAYASLSTLKLLAAYGANFRQSNALHRAAEGGLHANSEEECIGVLQWLLQDSIGVSINQREFEFSGMNMWEEMSSATALHCAVRANALSCARFLLASGIDTGLKDKRGRSARDLGMELGHGEAVRVLDELVGPAMELADS